MRVADWHFSCFFNGMSRHLKKLFFSLTLVSIASSFVIANVEAYGPMPVVASPITNMNLTFNRKLEVPTQALDLAVRDSGGLKLTDGLIVLQDDVTIDAPVLDPNTNLPQVGPDGKPLTTPILYKKNTILDPLNKPEDNILLPVDVTVSANAVINGDFPIGRFGYIGVAPRFASKNLEMFASKMGHSLRVKAFVTQDILDTYEFNLLSRFKSYSDMLAKPTIHLETLQNLKQMAANSTNASMKKWYTVTSYYGKHLYENRTLDIYDQTTSEADYKTTILALMIQTYFGDPVESLETAPALIEKYLALYNQYKTDPTTLAARRDISAALFKAHFKDLYVEGTPVPPIFTILPLVTPSPLPSGAPSPIPSPLPLPAATLPTHPDALGVLTFVYPIAIDKDGPFKLPSPGLRKFPLSSSIEGRWFSNRWLSEFGGFPFLQITADGVAFHGPITMGDDGKTWFLRRGNVSHSCMRMDPSDILELRALIPKNMNDLQRLNQTIPLRITEWPDVADIDNNGTNEVMDVAYYSIPTSGAAIGDPLTFRPSVYNKTYWTNMFSPYIKSKRLGSKNTFRVTTSKITDPTTGKVSTVNGGVFTGLPKYDVVQEVINKKQVDDSKGRVKPIFQDVLEAVGYYSEPLPIKTFAQRPTQIIQYREDGVLYQDADNGGGDNWGSFPPKVVNKF
jgi:hypothetical protein